MVYLQAPRQLMQQQAVPVLERGLSTAFITGLPMRGTTKEKKMNRIAITFAALVFAGPAFAEDFALPEWTKRPDGSRYAAIMAQSVNSPAQLVVGEGGKICGPVEFATKEGFTVIFVKAGVCLPEGEKK